MIACFFDTTCRIIINTHGETRTIIFLFEHCRVNNNDLIYSTLYIVDNCRRPGRVLLSRNVLDASYAQM